MTIKKRLFISFALILLIIVFIIGVFFYSTYNLNQIHSLQKHRYDQIRRVEKLKEYNNSFAWIVLDVITDYNKAEIVKNRIRKADLLFKELNIQKQTLIENVESMEEKKKIELILFSFEKMYSLIQKELLTYIKKGGKNFLEFNTRFDKKHKSLENLLTEEISYLQERLYKTELTKDDFIYKIKLELVILLLLSVSLSFIISRKIINEIQEKLKKLNKGVLQLFTNEENTIRVDIGKNNELSEITDNLNSYLEKQDDIIRSREELLRNISHELKTPITKGKFLVEKLKDQKEQEVIENINKVFIDIEELTSKLLQREKLNFATLSMTKFKVSTLILEALSKLSIEDESKVLLEIEDDFEIEGDIYYLTMALKNLIDNGFKYATEYPIKIKAVNKSLFIENIAKQLSNDLIYYIQPFTREPNQQLGHGLGLNIVNKIIQMHNLNLNYSYKAPYNIFSIDF